MKIIVTGGLGFIGHHLVQQLCNLGHQLSIIDNVTDYGSFNSAEVGRLVSSRLKTIPESVTIYRADINDCTDFHSIFNNNSYDVIIHLASFPRQKTVSKNPALAAKTMIEGTVNLLQACNNVGKFIFVSSSMVYGDFSGSVNEESLCNPKGQYGILKLAGENLVKDWSNNTGIPYTVIRPSAVYGARDISDRIVPKFLTAASGNKPLNVNGKDESIDFTHVSDLVSGIALAVKKKESENQTFNMTRGSARTIYNAAQVATAIADGGIIEVNNPDGSYPSRGTLNITKANTLLGYTPTVDIEVGFKKTYNSLINQ